MNVKNFMSYIPRTSIDSSALTSSYQPINPNGTSGSCWTFDIINNSTSDIDVSFNGSTDHDFIPANSIKIIDIQTNSQPNNDINLMKKGQIVYVKGSAGTGIIYLVGRTNTITNIAGL